MVYFAVINAVKVGPYLFLGLFDATNLGTSVALAPAGALGLICGLRIRERIRDRPFYVIVCAFMFGAGIKLLYDGVTGAA